MNAARELIIPIQAHPFALEGLDKLHEVQALVRDQMNPHLAITGVLITMFDTRTNVSRQTVERLRNDARFADRIFDTIVRVNTRIPESQGRGVPVIHYDTSSHGARAYRKLAREVGDMNGRPPAAQEPAQQRAEESGPA
jgi:chromosome partitioning protein